MRILHVVHQYYPSKVGGVEIYTQAVSRVLAWRGYKVAVFYRRDAPGRGLSLCEESGVQVYTVWDGIAGMARRFLQTFGNRFIHQAFRQVLEEFRPNIVHVQHLMGLPVSIVDEIRPRALPIVITLWDYWWICANALLLTNYNWAICDGPRAYWNCARCALARAGHPQMVVASPLLVALLFWRNQLLRKVLNAAHLLIAPTDFVRRWYVSHGFPEERMVLLPHGLEYSARTTQERRLSGDGIRFLYMGGLSWHKGVHILIEAFKGLQGNAELWVAGDESADQVYVSYLRTLAGPNVRFLGRLDREVVWTIIAQADVVAVPSLCYETHSFLISEAFAAGLPVLASRLGALAERVRDGVDGLLIPPGDVAAWRAAIQRLIDEPDLLPRLRANVRPPMTMQEHVEKLEELYASLKA